MWWNTPLSTGRAPVRTRRSRPGVLEGRKQLSEATWTWAGALQDSALPGGHSGHSRLPVALGMPLLGVVRGCGGALLGSVCGWAHTGGWH